MKALEVVLVLGNGSVGAAWGAEGRLLCQILPHLQFISNNSTRGNNKSWFKSILHVKHILRRSHAGLTALVALPLNNLVSADGSDVDSRVGCTEGGQKFTGRNSFFTLANTKRLRARVQAQVSLLVVADSIIAACRRMSSAAGHGLRRMSGNT